MIRTSVTPEGKFIVALHRPSYRTANFREGDGIGPLGSTGRGEPCDNSINFPPEDVAVASARPIYEIPNAFPFRGTTYIDSDRADKTAAEPESISLEPPREYSLSRILARHLDPDRLQEVLAELPVEILYAMAATSTDPDELVRIARGCCRIEYGPDGTPSGLGYLRQEDGKLCPDIDDFELFETVANNPHLPDAYKEVMVLRPGVQGTSPIVGEYSSERSHVFEYLRSNSYIPWGHYAANMANDAVRYRTGDLDPDDMHGLRHLYYQRMFVVLAEKTGIEVPERRGVLTTARLEELRESILAAIGEDSEKAATLWGWNFGYDFSPSGYRLHASHQMIHQQYAMVPEKVATADGTGEIEAYSCGDLVADTAARYRDGTGSDFFSDFLTALRRNTRTDRQKGPDSLVVWEDENVVLYVPKAQVSQWELQLMVLADAGGGPVGNVLEADTAVRRSLDLGILAAQHIYAGLHARMVTTVEFSKRIGLHNGQRLFYSFLPKLPWAMGAFSEAELRFICGHYPEDFAACCRMQAGSLNHGN
jgi:hypothetical protein